MSSSSSLTNPSAHAPPKRSAVKRHRLRKGTFSCWECKHRKTRCEFKPLSSTVCVSCQRRGLSCVSQEFADNVDSGYVEVEKRIVHVESLVGQLVRQRSTGQPQLHLSQLLSTDARNDTRLLQSPSLAAGQDLRSRCRALSGYLHTILPHPSVAALILNRSKFFKLPPQALQQPLEMSTFTATDEEELARLSELPSPTAHPIHFARKLIQLAICLQQLDATTSEQPELRLNEPARDAARRYVDIVSCHVTSQDLLIDSLEGLETLMLEATYHINLGNLRVAWLIFHRAISIGQLIDLPRLAESTGRRPDLVWFRLIFADRFLSLHLGLTFAVADKPFALTVDEPSERLERIQVVAAGRIIARNVRMQRRRPNHEQSEDDGYDDYKETQDIDYELKQAARFLPVNWWILPNLKNVASDVDTTEKTDRLLTQMHQHYLLVVLHQPYLVQRRHPQPTSSSTGSMSSSVDYTYSKLAALSASREVLSRFLEFCSLQYIPSYRGVVSKAFTASMTLLLAHIEGHRLGRGNVLEHQRPHDLGIIDNVIGSIERVSHLTVDASSSSSAQLLRELVAIESDAVDGANFFAWFGEDDIGKKDRNVRKDEHSLKLPIPYFGTIHVARRELVSLQLPSLDSDPIQMAEHAPELSNTAYECNNLRSANGGSFLTMDPSISASVASSESQLRTDAPSCAALDFDEIDTAYFSTWIQGEAQGDATLTETDTWLI